MENFAIYTIYHFSSGLSILFTGSNRVVCEEIVSAANAEKNRGVRLWMNRKTRRVRTFTRSHKKKRSNKEGREGIHAWDDGGREMAWLTTCLRYVIQRTRWNAYHLAYARPGQTTCISYLTAAAVLDFLLFFHSIDIHRNISKYAVDAIVIPLL